jgi:pilus assembly protein Flp/PilA
MEHDMKSTLLSFLQNDLGATAIEYALIASLIAVFIIAALQNLGTKLSSEFSEVANALK